MKFSDLLAGTRNRRTIKVRIGAAEDVAIDLRVLTPEENVTVLERARSFATGKGATTEPTDPIYLLGLEVYTLQLACVDSESPADKPTPFFESADAILQSELLSRDTLAYLHSLYEEWCDESSVFVSELSEGDFIKLVGSVGGGDMLPFCRLRPGMQWSFVRSLTLHYLRSLQAKSISSVGSESLTSESNGSSVPQS